MSDQIVTVQIYLTPNALGRKEELKKFAEEVSLKHNLWAGFHSRLLGYVPIGQMPTPENYIVCVMSDSPEEEECNRITSGIGVDTTDHTHFISDPEFSYQGRGCGLPDFEAFLVEVNRHPAVEQIYVYSDDTHGYPGDFYEKTVKAENFCEMMLSIPYWNFGIALGKFTILKEASNGTLQSPTEPYKIEKKKGTAIMFDQKIAFTSPEFEAAVRNSLEKPEGPIFQSDLKKVTHLSLEDLPTIDNDVLKQCTELSSVFIVHSKPEVRFRWDCTTLASLPKLNFVDLTNLSEEELEKVGCLTNIEYLRVFAMNSVKDRVSVRAAASGSRKTLKKLLVFCLTGNYEFDCDELLDFPELTDLQLICGQLLHLTSLAKLENLENVEFLRISSADFQALEEAMKNKKRLTSMKLEYKKI